MLTGRSVQSRGNGFERGADAGRVAANGGEVGYALRQAAKIGDGGQGFVAQV